MTKGEKKKKQGAKNQAGIKSFFGKRNHEPPRRSSSSAASSSAASFAIASSAVASSAAASSRTPSSDQTPTVPFAAASARSLGGALYTDDKHGEYGDNPSSSAHKRKRLFGQQDHRKPAANPEEDESQFAATKGSKWDEDDGEDVDDGDSRVAKKPEAADPYISESDAKKRKKKKKKRKKRTASAEEDESWNDPRRGGAARGGDSAVPKRDEDSINATLAYSDQAANLCAVTSDNLRRHSFRSFHSVPKRNEVQRAATEAAKSGALRAVNFLAERHEVIDVNSPIHSHINRDHKMFNANNGRTNAYHIENRSADGRYDGKFGIGGPDRPGYYIDELGRETFDCDVTMTSLVDLDNIDADTQRKFTEMMLDALRPLGCKTIPKTVFDLVECARTGLPAALQLAILLIDTPSTQCNDLGGLMEVNAWLLEFAKVFIETGVTQRARRRDPSAGNFQQLDEWLRCNDVGFGAAGQQHAYSMFNVLLTLLPRRIRETLLKRRHRLKILANWKPGVVKTDATRLRPEGSRGAENIYAMLCTNASDFMDAQETPPTGDTEPTSADIKKCYNTSLYTKKQNRQACDKRDGVLREHAENGGCLLAVEQCRTSMVERGGMDMVSYIMGLRPFKEDFKSDESTGDEPRWTPVVDPKTEQPLLLPGGIVFLYMNVDWDEQLRLIAVIDNPSDMIDSNTDRSHTWDDISGMCNTSMGMDVLKYASNLLEAENAEIVKKIDITTMPFRDSFSVMFGLIVYYKKFLNLPPKSSSLFFQNLMQPPGVNLHRDGFTGLLRKDEYDLFGLSARAKKRKGDEKQTGIDRDRLVHRSIVAAGSTGKDLEECLERMEEATLRDRNNGFVVITDPKEISDKSRHFVRSARGEGFIDKVLTDMYEDKFRSKAANSGNKDNHNTSAYANLTTLDGELTHYKETGYEFFAQGAGSADINNPNWGKDFLVTTPSGEKIYKKMIIPSAGPLTYKDVLTGEVKTIDFDPRYFVAGAAAGNLKQRCSKSKYDQAVKAAEKQAAKGKASKRKKTVWFPDHQFQIKRGMAKFEQGKIVAVNEHNIIQGRFVRGGDGVIYYD